MNYELRAQSYTGEWVTADVAPNEVIAMTYQANNIAELKNRQANRSNKIKLPRTATNDTIFGFSGEIRSAYDHAYRRLPCTLAIDGIQISGAGSCLQLTAVTRTYYECTIFGGIFDFFTAIKEARLRDLKGIEDINAWIAWKIKESYDLSDNYDVLFPIMDWNMEEEVPSKILYEEDADKNQPPGIDIQSLYPCVRLKRLLENICTEQGYTLKTDVEAEDRYLNAAIPCVSHYKDLRNDGLEEYQQNPDKPLVELRHRYQANVGQDYDFTNSGTTTKIQEGIPVAANFFTRTRGSLDYRAVVNGQYFFEMSFGSQGSDGRRMRLKVTKGVTVVFNATTTDRFNRKLKVKLNEGEILTFVLSSDAPEGAPCNVLNLHIACSSIAQDLDESAELTGKNFPIVRNLPDISQLDLFKLFLQVFGLTVQVNNRARVVSCFTFGTVYANRKADTVRDWSGKLDGRSTEIGFQLDYAQRNYLRYKEYDSVSVRGKQDEEEIKTESVGFFDVGDSTLKPEQDLFELAAVACDEVPHFNLGHTAKIRLRRNGKVVKNGPFALLYLNKIQQELGKKFRLVDGSVTGTNGVTANTIVLAEFWPFDAQELLDNYYHELSSRLLRRSRLLLVEMLLTPTDVADFDHSIPVYLRQYNAYFYVNKISNYRSDKLTKVELVRL